MIQKGHTEGNSVCCKNKQSNISLEYIIKCRIMLFSNEGSFQGCERGKKKSKRGSKNIEWKNIMYIYMHVWKCHNKPLHFVMLIFTNKAILKDTLWKIWQKESSVRWSHLTFKMRSRNIVSLIASFLLSKTSILFRNPYGSNYKKKCGHLPLLCW